MNRKTFAWLAAAFAASLLVVMPLLLIMLRSGMVEFAPDEAAYGPWLLGAAAVLGVGFVFLLITIGIYVYRDARERGMDPGLWTLAAVLVPYFIGFIAYLIVRQSRRVVCPGCGARSTDSARFCPACGRPLKASCPSCKLPVEGGARFCPGCGVALTSEPTLPAPPAR
jgi:hypothetical protein